MKKKTALRLDPSSVHMRLGLCAAALTGTAAAIPAAQADIITFNTPISVPNTFAGVYINLTTGANGPSPTTGWDFNPFSSSGTLAFYWSGAGLEAMGVATGVGSTSYADLAIGTLISAASPFTAATAGTSPNYLTTGTHILGFEFLNDNTGVLNFGYALVQTTASAGFPTTILSWSFDNTGAPITVIPEPSTTGLLALGALVAGAIGMREWRRKRAA
jgi:PEP-CTERM motif